VSPGHQAWRAPHEGSNTTHYSIADKLGQCRVGHLHLNDWFGAKVTVPAPACC
jgi:gamma-glutamyltranspeptidase/glutathione hydrolase